MPNNPLQTLIDKRVDSSFPLHSRAHKMQKSPFYIKRDDELGIMGSKIRKYASILPFLREKQQVIALTGSAYSNHILSFVQLLKQESIPYLLFLEKPKNLKIEGNYFFLSLLTKKEEIIWLDKIPEHLSTTWKQQWEEKYNHPLLFIPLGGCMKEGLVGACTLAVDIAKNEEELGVTFDEIFVDVGTGITACALLLGLRLLSKSTFVTFVLMAGTEEEFEKNLSFFHQTIEEDLQAPFPRPIGYRCIFPSTAKSFGSCNTTVLKTIQNVAYEEGIFLDPLYSSKLYLTVKEKNLSPKGKVLWIHSGGILSLCGFQEALLKQKQAEQLS